MADPSLREVLDFPEVKDKIIGSIELSSDLESFDLTITFTDKTTLNFAIEPRVVVFPRLSDWTGGEENTIKKYKPVSTKTVRP